MNVLSPEAQSPHLSEWIFSPSTLVITPVAASWLDALCGALGLSLSCVISSRHTGASAVGPDFLSEATGEAQSGDWTQGTGKELGSLGTVTPGPELPTTVGFTNLNHSSAAVCSFPTSAYSLEDPLFNVFLEINLFLWSLSNFCS